MVPWGEAGGFFWPVLGLLALPRMVGWLVDPLDRSQNDCSAAAGPETTSEKETENESDH